MSDPEREELLKLREENRRLANLLKEALEGNKILQKQLVELQEKLDIFIVQFKKRNRRDFGSKTERHNPRPAAAEETPKIAVVVEQAIVQKPKAKHEKHILAQDLPTVEVAHTVTPEAAICPHCIVDTIFVHNEVTHQLERLQHSLQRLRHLQEVRACPKCKQYIVTAEKPCPLKGFTGIVQADAATGFDALFRDGTKTEAGCSAHSRRRYFDCLVVEPVMADKVLKIYSKLYENEEKARNATPAVRLAIRRRFSKPWVKKLRKVIVKMQSSLTPKHPLMQAIDYTLNHWLALTRFLKNAEIEIDNNASEREIKAFVLDRKNFLFAGSDAGGEAIATLLSLIASAKRNKVDPRKYLTDVFTRINSMKTTMGTSGRTRCFIRRIRQTFRVLLALRKPKQK